MWLKFVILIRALYGRLGFSQIMFRPLRKLHPVVKVVNGVIIDLPAARNLSAW